MTDQIDVAIAAALPHFRKSPAADERNPGHVIQDCVAASGVNIARAANNGATPATDAEVHALRVATGDTSGAEDLTDLQKGMWDRYSYSTTLDDQWRTIADGVLDNMWFVVIGDYFALPARIRNAGQKDVGHAIAVGPSAKQGHVTIVDSLQKPVVRYEDATLGELRSFCATGNNQSLGIREYSHIPPPASHRISIAPKTTVRQAVLKGGCIEDWNDRVWGKTESTAPCSAPVVKNICGGGQATVVYVTRGTFAKRWVHLGSGVALV